MRITVILLLLIMFVCVGCASKKIKDISYLQATEAQSKNLPKLNIFTKRSAKEKLPVLIFVHGGNWNTGSKDTYGFMAEILQLRELLPLFLTTC